MAVVNQSIYDYFGVPTQLLNNLEVNALVFRGYNLIYNEWFRPQDIIEEVDVPLDDGPDDEGDYELLKRAKRHDYFTSCLPWPQKGDAVELPIGASAPVIGDGNAIGFVDGSGSYAHLYADSSYYDASLSKETVQKSVGDTVSKTNLLAYDKAIGLNNISTGMVADLSEATASTINELREAFQLQKMLEKDARGGTRYTEILKNHFGVVSPDARLQRPEYLGGSSQRINISQVQQTSETSTTELGTLGAFGMVFDNKARFSKSFTEHGHIIGLACVRSDLTYQQGLHRMFSRQTRYDFPWPSLAHLGEQEVLMKELYCTGASVNDDVVFGYQERYAEFRYGISKITGKMRSNDAQTLDVWHLSQEFGSQPTLNQTFIEESPPIDRVTAIEDEPEFKFDSYFELYSVRPLPVYSVPGLIDHF